MAQVGEIIVRPTYDYYKINCVPSSGDYIYSTINETTPDDATLYTNATTVQAEGTQASSFEVGVAQLTDAQLKTIGKINSITIYIRTCSMAYTGNTIRFGLSSPVAATTDVVMSTTGWNTYSYVYNLNGVRPSNFNLNSLRLYFYFVSFGTSVDIKATIVNSITQMYAVINYQVKKVSAFIKVENVFKEADSAYVKIDGVWKEIDAIYVKIDGVWKTG